MAGLGRCARAVSHPSRTGGPAPARLARRRIVRGGATPPAAAAATASSGEQQQAAQQAGAGKVAFVSLGCPKNVVDGEVMLGDLVRHGFSLTDDPEDADAIVLNTCSFVEDAKSESIEAIMEAAGLNEDGRRRRIVVTGCLAQRYGEALANDLPEADLVVGFQNYSQLGNSLRSSMGLEPLALDAAAAASSSGVAMPAAPAIDDPAAGEETGMGLVPSAPVGARVQVGSATVPFRPEWDRVRLTPRHTAYLRVAEGCNHACTFCAIPGFRGKFRSKPFAPLLDEARRLVAEGAVELNLIAEDTNQWGQDRRDGRNLAHLLRELSAIEGLRWIRLLYCYPSYFSDELIDEIATNSKVAKYIDMPLQHIDNLVLLAMNRPPRAHTETLLQKLRERIPDLALRTTFISGFPGETAEQHAELVSFVRGFKFERMGAFTFSEEDGTPAAELPEQVAPELRVRRRDELVSLQQRISEGFAQSLVGRTIEVLVDAVDEDGTFIARTQWDAPDVDPLVFLSEAEDASLPRLEVGQMRRARIDGASIFDLEATVVA
ncbi:hypothetical protein Rsub_12072 [Raphidocelis subcapitata]|uniref:Uncharacterized protein n=1 Tax=Raphidocelis subcapitata TaxID=307507 RepID=A0A2V0PII7_9CHLO|nr:hypothetical protein Rsub_12072 [Raphidocelis subcapitata]|eukprot:GBF99608.1 hypothetical protein Rsub_12072 [Raphidocelis subcapitata]